MLPEVSYEPRLWPEKIARLIEKETYTFSRWSMRTGKSEPQNIEQGRAKINPKSWEFRASGMKLVVVTQWVRFLRSKSHLAKG